MQTAFKKSYKLAGISTASNRVPVVALSSQDEEIPLFPTDLRPNVYTSAQIDDWFARHVVAGTTGDEDFNAVGSGNPTAASADDRQTLFDLYNKITYNEGFTG